MRVASSDRWNAGNVEDCGQDNLPNPAHIFRVINEYPECGLLLQTTQSLLHCFCLFDVWNGHKHNISRFQERAGEWDKHRWQGRRG